MLRNQSHMTKERFSLVINVTVMQLVIFIAIDTVFNV